MCQDRSDIQFAVKELSRSMSKPTQHDWTKLKRLGRYLIDKPRSRTILRYQYTKNKVVKITAFTDSDYAGCTRTRRSTSGGVLKVGQHTIKTWSSTQAVVALSSGEAEYYALVKGAAQAIGIRNMLKDIGVATEIEIKTDANAAIGIGSRRGTGKVRHLETNQLWVQDKVAKKRNHERCSKKLEEKS